MPIDLPDLEWSETSLVPEERITKGVPNRALDGDLESRILLGGPICRPLEQILPAGDPALVAATAEQDSVAYTMTDLAVTFEGAEEERIEKVWVQIKLTATQASQPPIVWSMTPDKVSSPVEMFGSADIKADLKVFTAGVSTSRKTIGEATFLEALNLLRPDPVWEFSRSAAHEIKGAHRLVLVVRSPARIAVEGRLSITASIRRKHWNIIPYRVLLAGGVDTSMFPIRS